MTQRPRVLRETRLLLTATLCAVVVLWILARLRFPDHPPAPNPVAPLISQLALTPKFDDLAGEVAALQRRLEPSLMVVRPPLPGGDGVDAAPVTFLKVRADLAVAITASGLPNEVGSHEVLIRDPASGLTLAAIPGDASVAAPVPWVPRRVQDARYLLASDGVSERPTLRPVFIGSLEPLSSPEWTQPVWRVPTHTVVTPGTFLFSTIGELAGVVVNDGSATAIVPAEVLLADVDRLFSRAGQQPVGVGISVQSLTPELAATVGATDGVIVTSVEEDGADGALKVADVIESANGTPVTTARQWEARVARLVEGETITLKVRRGAPLDARAGRPGQPREPQVFEARVIAAAVNAPPHSRALGLSVRLVPRDGVEVTGVERGSAADRAGLAAGDILTLFGEVQAPTPAELRAAFAAMREGESTVVAFTRGGVSRLTALRK